MDYQHPVFIKRYCKEQNLDEKTAEMHFTELKKFLIVCRTNIGKVRSTPSRKVDEAWHLFILFTRDYAAFCEKYLGQFIHHKPTLVENEEEAQVMMNAYENTREIAVQLFGESNLDLELWPIEAENLVADSGVSSFVCSDFGGNN